MITKRILPNAAFLAGGVAMILCACSHSSSPTLTKSGIDPANFVGEYNGKPTTLYTLENANGMEACITNFGGRIVSFSALTV